MTTIVTRSGKGSALTWAEADANFTNLNTDKLEKVGGTATGLTVSGADFVSRGITDSATAKALTLTGSGANSVTITNSATNPVIGTTAGNLLLSPAGGTGDVVTSNGANAVYFKAINTNNAIGAMYGVDSSGIAYAWNRNASSSNFYIGNGNVGNAHGVLLLQTCGVTQLVVSAVASANRYLTIAGSNGSNPTIGTSGGNLALSSATNYVNVTGVLEASQVVWADSGTATPVGGAVATGFAMGQDVIRILWGLGAPNKSAARGSLYIRTDNGANTSLYINRDGGTTWAAVTSA